MKGKDGKKVFLPQTMKGILFYKPSLSNLKKLGQD
jgi:hypothetical protein